MRLMTYQMGHPYHLRLFQLYNHQPITLKINSILFKRWLAKIFLQPLLISLLILIPLPTSGKKQRNMRAGVLFQNCTVIDLGFTVKKDTAAS